jgi:hypothetical protein
MKAEGADIAPESPDGLEGYEKLAEPRGECSNPEALIEALEVIEKVLTQSGSFAPDHPEL